VDWFRFFAGLRRASLRDLVRLRIRRAGVLLLFNAESARLLNDQPGEQDSKRELQNDLERLRGSDK
jgi:hypothetical protein